MKLVKSLLLGSAAGLAATVGAHAADLPFRKAAPVDYVRVCDWTGAGYFYMPGTDSCIKIGGRVQFEYAFIEPKKFFDAAGSSVLGAPTAGRNRSRSGLFADGRIETDIRTQTAYGLLRTFVRFQINTTSGNFAGENESGTKQSVSLNKGFIQFAGFTAGRAQSLFDFYADNYNEENIANSDSNVNTFAYTATFGGGFSATLGVEDRNNRDVGIGNIAGVGAFAGDAQYAGETIPNVIGVLLVDQAWGSAQLSGAYHQVNTVSGAYATGDLAHTDEDGFAVQAGVHFKLPMLAAGDELWLEGAYQQGAVSYQDTSGTLSAGALGGHFLGGLQHNDVDAVAVGNANGVGYTLHKAEGFSVLAALHHYFTPQFHDVLFGSYEEIGYGNAVRNTSVYLGGLGDASQYRIGNQFIFTPVHNLDILVEVLYAKLNQDVAGGVALPVGVVKNPDTFEARLHIERDF